MIEQLKDKQDKLECKWDLPPLTDSQYQYPLLRHSIPVKVDEKASLTRDLEDRAVDCGDKLPLFISATNSIKVPAKTINAVCNIIPHATLRTIHKNLDVARDLCLLFLSKFTSTYFIMKDNPDDPVRGQGWKALHSDILKQEFNIKGNTYKKIVDALGYKTRKGPIIQCDNKYYVGKKTFYYRLSDAFRCKGVDDYQLKTDLVKVLYRRNCGDFLTRQSQNTIVRNLLEVYPQITFPSEEEILEEARRLIEVKFTTKKGKTLTFRNKHPDSYFKNPEQRSFVEDSILLFKYLTQDGLMMPYPTKENNGFRIIDSFTLMPSWIRNLCRINGGKIMEVDYSALHPNIAMTIYDGKGEFITHKGVSDASGIPEQVIKKEHLAFFNKEWEDMLHSPLNNYYQAYEPTMLQNIYEDKIENGYKITSMRMLKKEVEIITDVIIKLNILGVYVGYIYDCLFCEPKYKKLVMETMNEVVLQHNVKTKAK